MIPFGKYTVTVLHRISGDTWTPCVVQNASWSQRSVRVIADGDARMTMETTCRIPYGNVMPDAGDVIVFGTCADGAENDIALAKLLQRYRAQGAFRVQSVANNALPGTPLAHYCAKGE